MEPHSIGSLVLALCWLTVHLRDLLVWLSLAEVASRKLAVITAAGIIHVRKLWWMSVLLPLGFMSKSETAGSQVYLRVVGAPSSSWTWL